MITVKELSKQFTFSKHDSFFRNILFKGTVSEDKVINAVQNLTFHIDPGEIVGLIGINASGKSTTLKMLAGILMPSGGFVRVNGLNPFTHKNEYLNQIGTFFGHNTMLWNDMRVIDSFEMMKHMYRITEYQYKNNLKNFIEMLDIQELIYLPVQKLSLGQRMRVDFAGLMLHEPKILFLDEPTIGLDIIAKEKILNFIRHISTSRETTIMITSHNLKDIEQICDRLLILDSGQLVYNGNTRKVKDSFDIAHVMEVEFKNLSLPDIQDLPIKHYSINNNKMSLSYDNRIINSSVILKHLINQCPVKNVKLYEPKLNDIITKLCCN